MAQLKKRIGALLCMLCLLAPLTSAESFDIFNCLAETAVVVASRVDVSPFPPTKDQSVTFLLDASTEKEISSGEVVTEFRGFEQDYELKSYDICETTTCPITRGDFSVNVTQVWPETIGGHYGFTLLLKDGESRDLGCFNFHIDL